MAATELKGSRKVVTRVKTTHAVRLLASTDGDNTGQEIGDYYPSESGPTGRVVMDADVQPEALPGLFYHVIQYTGFRSYA